MKMYDRNGKLSIVARVIFEANMKRLRSGDSPTEITKSLGEQVKVLTITEVSYSQPNVIQGTVVE